MTTRSEWRWVVVVSLAVLLLASLPTLYAWSLAGADHVFTGFVYNTEDGNSYLAKMRLGARGEWMFRLFYTPEEHEGALVFTFHLLLGKIAAALHLPFELAYHLARVIFGLFLLLTVYAFVAHFSPNVAERRLGWLLVAIGSGLGWLVAILGASRWLGDLPLDFWVPEAYVFLVLYNLPHLAVAEALLLWSILWTMHAFEGRGLQWCFGAALAALFMAAIVPFYAGALAAVLGAYLLALSIGRRRIPWREAGLTVLTGLGAVPPVAYNAWVFSTNPAFAIWAEQNRILSPHPLHYVLGFALLLVPAFGGARLALRQKQEHWLLLIGWVLAVPLLLYFPFNLQRRMVVLLQVPLALLAARGLLAWLGKQGPKRQRWGTAAYVGLASLSNLLLVLGNLGPIAMQETPIYRPGAEIEALKCLNNQATADEIILASFEVGNVIPAHTDLRVFAGHGPETLYGEEKKDTLRQFYGRSVDDDWRRALLAEFDLDYIFWGPIEQSMGDWDPGTAPYLIPICSEPGYTVFRVALDKAGP